MSLYERLLRFLRRCSGRPAVREDPFVQLGPPQVMVRFDIDVEDMDELDAEIGPAVLEPPVSAC